MTPTWYCDCRRSPSPFQICPSPQLKVIRKHLIFKTLSIFVWLSFLVVCVFVWSTWLASTRLPVQKNNTLFMTGYFSDMNPPWNRMCFTHRMFPDCKNKKYSQTLIWIKKKKTWFSESNLAEESTPSSCPPPMPKIFKNRHRLKKL